MTEFKNATITKKANVYFEGKVTSRKIVCADGSKKTLGIMLPGEYDFTTNEHEVMEVLGGAMTVKFPNSDEWRTFGEGDTFAVPAGKTFKLKIAKVVDYCCSYG